MNPLAGVTVLDGGLATELEARGHELNDALWSARLLRDDPDAIRAVHAAYLDAGAQCIITASYQATIETLGAERMLLAVELAREARGERDAVIAASVGPYGAARADGSEYTGRYDLNETGLHAWHAERFELLAGSGADVLACETLPSFAEMRALARLLDETPGAAAWFSFSCRDGTRISDGTLIRDCAAYLEPIERVVAIGVNCTPPRFVELLIGELRAATTKPILVYPNSGEEWDAARRCWAGERDPEEFAEAAARWRRAGAAIVGGCCRTGPEHIRELTKA